MGFGLHYPNLWTILSLLLEKRMTPEGKVKVKIKRLLFRYNAYFFMPATGGYGRSGVPDFVGCVNGKFFAIETKAADNKPTALQQEELDSIRQHKGVAFVVNEVVGYDLLVKWLEEQASLDPTYIPVEISMTVPDRRLPKRIRMPINDNLND